MKATIIPQSKSFLALKWAIAKQFQEYLNWKPFVVKTTPNLDSTRHCWVESLAKFTFSIKYQKGRDIAATDAPRCVTSKLDASHHEVHPGWSHHGND